MLQYSQLQVALALIAGLGLVRAGELDIPGLGYVNRAAPLAEAPWKRASGQQTYGLSQNYQGKPASEPRKAIGLTLLFRQVQTFSMDFRSSIIRILRMGL